MRGKADKHDPAEMLDYIRTMLGQLRGMAEADRHDMLAYLIGMAYVEATDLTRGNRQSRVDGEERDQSAGLSRQSPGQV